MYRTVNISKAQLNVDGVKQILLHNIDYWDTYAFLVATWFTIRTINIIMVMLENCG